MSDSPFSLIEILVAEYEQQAKMNGWDDLLPDYSSAKIRAKRDEIEKQARARVPGGSKPEASSARDESSEDELTPEQQDFVCIETDKLLEGFYKLLHDRAKNGQPRSAICFS